MKASLLFRIAAILILLFAAGHTFGFRQIDPRWGLTETIESMKTVRFKTQGFDRTYWDFYAGFGFFVTVLLLFAAAVVWQIGGTPSSQWATVRGLAWTTTLCFGLVVVLSWRFFFAAPVIFSALIFLCLLTATLIAQRSA